MSFTENVKNELARLPRSTPGERRAELLALLRMSGSAVTGGSGAWGVEFSTGNSAVARRVLVALKKDFGLVPTVMVRQGRKLRKKNVYTLAVPPSRAGTDFLSSIGFLSMGGMDDVRFCRTAEEKRAYLAGAFLGGGSISRPQSDYHLEMVTQSRHFAEEIREIMHAFRMAPRLTDRKNDYIVYIKDGDEAGSFLQITGAAQSYMEFENVRVMKDMRNQVNRQVNCETANLQKSVNAAVRQMHQIRTVAAFFDRQAISKKLAETMELRMAHPNATLAELSELCGVSRSGLAHRFRKIAALAEQAEGAERTEKNIN